MAVIKAIVRIAIVISIFRTAKLTGDEIFHADDQYCQAKLEGDDRHEDDGHDGDDDQDGFDHAQYNDRAAAGTDKVEAFWKTRPRG